MDLEMTGLNPNTEVIIECASIVTDYDFQVLETYETVIKQPQHYLDQMDNWNKKHHSASGLLDRVPYGKEPKFVEDELLALLRRHWPVSDKRDDMPLLAGNSIMQDRIFLDKYCPNLSQKIHYRMLDVTSWKILFNEKYNIRYEKKNSHRALDDIRESIEELKFYLQCTQIEF